MTKSNEKYQEEDERAFELAKEFFLRTVTCKKLYESTPDEMKDTFIDDIFHNPIKDIVLYPLLKFISYAVSYCTVERDECFSDFVSIDELKNIYSELRLILAHSKRIRELKSKKDTGDSGLDGVHRVLQRTLETGELVIKVDLKVQDKGRIIWEIGTMIDLIVDSKETLENYGYKVFDIPPHENTSNLDLLENSLKVWDLKKSGMENKEIIEEMEDELEQLGEKNKAVRNWYKKAQRIIDAFDKE